MIEFRIAGLSRNLNKWCFDFVRLSQCIAPISFEINWILSAAMTASFRSQAFLDCESLAGGSRYSGAAADWGELAPVRMYVATLSLCYRRGADEVAETQRWRRGLVR
jgi:hypothetical protein